MIVLILVDGLFVMSCWTVWINTIGHKQLPHCFFCCLIIVGGERASFGRDWCIGIMNRPPRRWSWRWNYRSYDSLSTTTNTKHCPVTIFEWGDVYFCLISTVQRHLLLVIPRKWPCQTTTTLLVVAFFFSRDWTNGRCLVWFHLEKCNVSQKNWRNVSKLVPFWITSMGSYFTIHYGDLCVVGSKIWAPVVPSIFGLRPTFW